MRCAVRCCVVGTLLVFSVVLLSSLISDIRKLSRILQPKTSNTLISNDHTTSPHHVSILLLAYYRGGSSFTAELLTHPRTSLYLFEPEKSRQFRLVPDLQGGGDREVSFYTRLFLCHYHGLEGFFFSKKVRIFLARDTNIRTLLKRDKGRGNITTLEDLCQRQQVRLLKTVGFRLDQSVLVPLIAVAQDAEVNLKVIHLVRDPRGMFSSRQQIGAGKPNATAAVEVMCEEMRRDLALGRVFRETLPDRYHLLRYEDVARAPEQVAVTLYRDFLGLTPDVSKLKSFISSHIHPLPGAKVRRYGTVREDPVKTADGWKSRLSTKIVREIEFICSDVISQLLYDRQL